MGEQQHDDNAETSPRRKPWWSFLLRRPVHFLLDTLVLTLTFVAAYQVRFEFNVPDAWVSRGLVQAPTFVTFQVLVLAATGVYNYIWRYVGLREAGTFVLAGAIWTVPPVVMRFVPDIGWLVLPWSIIVLDTVFGVVGVLGIRFVRRAIAEKWEAHDVPARARRKAVLLVGAGRAGALAARELQQRADSGLDIRGFVDDDGEKQGAVIQGVRVLGTTADLPRLVRETGVDHVVITIAQASRAEFRRLLDVCEAIPVKARVIPGLYEILQGRVSVSRTRNVEIEDLLGRTPVELDRELMQRFLTGRIVVVTGAGGSIGAELARQVARFGPRKLVLLEQAEGALFDVDRELRASHPDVAVEAVVADVVDEERVRAVFELHRPHVVLHAAAHKHVPLMEKNPGEAIKNNVLGTRAIARAAGVCGVDVFVLISTDKAVRPTSIMGASKRVAELVVQDLENQFEGTRFVAVRFGNVLGSTGSVIPLFREQIARGGPVTVTHPDMVRYFMTIPEAAQLVIQAGAMGEGGEIFILDMGEPVKILDLARDMIRLSGLRPHEDIDIVFSGIRPGEKLYEELQTDGESVSHTRHKKILIGRIAGVPRESLDAALMQLESAARRSDATAVRAILTALLRDSLLLGPDGASPSAPLVATLPASSRAG